MANKIESLEEQMLKWFRQYGSHVILHRAVPHIDDGLKPSQRRVLHSLWELEDGRYNKVANTVGNTLKYHPHGDASVFETLVGIAQKTYLIDTQGNWGNTLTGDGAAAARYIEGRLSPLAKECLFNPKTTNWQDSYDGRNKEPIVLPCKLPLLLIQGTEGIAVSLACKILPHNFNECCKAAIEHLNGRDFDLIPDFLLGGIIDTTAYRGGEPGGKVKIRAKIREEKNSLVIVEIPFGTTTGGIKDSILKADARGSIKIKKINDMTAETAEIVIDFPPGTDLDKAKEALYSFTDCEISHTINGVVIQNNKPVFLGTKELLKASVKRTQELITRELEIELEELDNQWHKLSLERIFIETRAYAELERATDEANALTLIRAAMAPRFESLRRQPDDEDIVRLTELKIRRISRFDNEKANRDIETLEAKEKVALRKLKKITETVIAHYENVMTKYGNTPRRTEISGNPFGKVVAAEVAVCSQKIYWEPELGFIGTGLKKAEALMFETNAMSDVAAISANGILKICRPGNKTFYAENLLDARLVDKDGGDIYNMIYEDLETGITYGKRFSSKGGFIREKTYPLAGGSEKNKVLFLEVITRDKPAPKLSINLDKNAGARKKELEFDMGTLAIKGKESQGNIICRYKIEKIQKQ